jgi:hypothetical protein
MTIFTTGGIYRNTLQPAFLTYLASNDLNVTGTGTVYTLGTNTALTEVFDQNSNATTAGVFTAPLTGRYQFFDSFFVIGTTIATTFTAGIVTSNRSYQYIFTRAASGGNVSPSLSIFADMDAGDTATATIAISGEAGNTDDLSGATSALTMFSGYMFC